MKAQKQIKKQMEKKKNNIVQGIKNKYQ